MKKITTQNGSPISELGKIGLDKIIFNHFDIKMIDEDKLRSKSSSDCSFTIEDGLLRKLRIKKQCGFERLTLEPKHGYCNLTLSVEDMRDTNIPNLQYAQYINHIKNTINPMLEREYGLRLILDHIRPKSMEANITIQTKYPIKEYWNAIQLLAIKISARYKKHIYAKQRQVENTEEIETIMFKNKYRAAIKFYNKSEQMKKVKGKETEGDLLRIEFYLKNWKAIEDYFHFESGNKSADLENNINDGYYKFFESLIFTPFKTWNKERQARLYKRLSKNKKLHGKKWAEYIIDECNATHFAVAFTQLLLLDYEELLINSDKYDLENNKRKNKRRIKPLTEYMKQKLVPEYQDNTIEKIEEIVNAILRACGRPEYHMYDELSIEKAKSISIVKSNKRAKRVKDVDKFLDGLQLDKWEKIDLAYMDDPIGEIKLNDLKTKIDIFEDERNQGYACYNYFYYSIPDEVLRELKSMFTGLKDKQTRANREGMDGNASKKHTRKVSCQIDFSCMLIKLNLKEYYKKHKKS